MFVAPMRSAPVARRHGRCAKSRRGADAGCPPCGRRAGESDIAHAHFMDEEREKVTREFFDELTAKHRATSASTGQKDFIGGVRDPCAAAPHKVHTWRSAR
jgi:hypothetical protein